MKAPVQPKTVDSKPAFPPAPQPAKVSASQSAPMKQKAAAPAFPLEPQQTVKRTSLAKSLSASNCPAPLAPATQPSQAVVKPAPITLTPSSIRSSPSNVPLNPDHKPQQQTKAPVASVATTSFHVETQTAPVFPPDLLDEQDSPISIPKPITIRREPLVNQPHAKSKFRSTAAERAEGSKLPTSADFPALSQLEAVASSPLLPPSSPSPFVPPRLTSKDVFPALPSAQKPPLKPSLVKQEGVQPAIIPAPVLQQKAAFTERQDLGVYQHESFSTSASASSDRLSNMLDETSASSVGSVDPPPTKTAVERPEEQKISEKSDSSIRGKLLRGRGTRGRGARGAFQGRTEDQPNVDSISASTPPAPLQASSSPKIPTGPRSRGKGRASTVRPEVPSSLQSSTADTLPPPYVGQGENYVKFPSSAFYRSRSIVKPLSTTASVSFPSGYANSVPILEEKHFLLDSFPTTESILPQTRSQDTRSRGRGRGRGRRRGGRGRGGACAAQEPRTSASFEYDGHDSLLF